MNNNRDTRTIISNPLGLVFATQKEWRRLYTDDVPVLEGYQLVTVKSNCDIYMLFRDMNPSTWSMHSDEFILLRITTSEETGSVNFYMMNLNSIEAEQFRDTPLPLLM